MTRCFIDISDDEQAWPDGESTEFETLAEAGRKAARVMGEIAKDALRHWDKARLTIAVRDANRARPRAGLCFTVTVLRGPGSREEP